MRFTAHGDFLFFLYLQIDRKQFAGFFAKNSKPVSGGSNITKMHFFLIESWKSLIFIWLLCGIQPEYLAMKEQLNYAFKVIVLWSMSDYP